MGGGAVHRVLIIQREKVRMIRIWKRKELKIKKSEVLNGRKKKKKKEEKQVTPPQVIGTEKKEKNKNKKNIKKEKEENKMKKEKKKKFKKEKEKKLKEEKEMIQKRKINRNNLCGVGGIETISEFVRAQSENVLNKNNDIGGIQELSKSKSSGFAKGKRIDSIAALLAKKKRKRNISEINGSDVVNVGSLSNKKRKLNDHQIINKEKESNELNMNKEKLININKEEMK